MRPVFIFLFSFSSVAMYAQDDATVYPFNKDWTPAKSMNKATYFMHAVKENDTVYICRYYRKEGPMIRWETFRDSTFETPNGRFAWYNEQGQLDSIGIVTNGHKDKNWYYNMDDSGRWRAEEYFEKGHFKSRTNFVSRMITHADGTTEPLDKPRRPDSLPAKTIMVVQQAAEFPGGIPAWTAYLSQNLHTPARLMRIIGPNAKATVRVEFIINRNGKIDNVFIWRSCEWSADIEAMRVIQSAPDWKPAEQNGMSVIYKHRQSITYQVNN